MKSTLNQTNIPLDVPAAKRSVYFKNLQLLTKRTGRLFLFAGDQRVEHLNDDFFGEDISPDDASPEHLFQIAATSRIGGFATQLGLVARLGRAYPRIPYIIKLNAKSNLVKTDNQDPYSAAWYDVRQVVEFAKNSKLTIPAVGYTVYVGSKFEAMMLREAAQIVWQAHQVGLVAIVWMYPRGQAIENKNDPHLIAGAVNIGTSLGADFLKVNVPQPNDASDYQEIMAAGSASRILFAGGAATSPQALLETIHRQVNSFGASGAALGRNIHQRSLREATALANAIAAIIYDGQSVEAAWRLAGFRN